MPYKLKKLSIKQLEALEAEKKQDIYKLSRKLQACKGELNVVRKHIEEHRAKEPKPRAVYIRSGHFAGNWVVTDGKLKGISSSLNMAFLAFMKLKEKEE